MAKKKKQVMNLGEYEHLGECPECQRAVIVESTNLSIGDEAACEECGVMLEVLEIDPLILVEIENEDDNEEEGDAAGSGIAPLGYEDDKDDEDDEDEV